ncbi:hypothetical protein C8J56DRAFT_1049164 [Mycena floridula]|nr:hypothetical protein C8J56DRAFT_1049164 [Mycena floridula]
MHCIAEVIDFMRQMLEGLVFMHEHNIPHRDISALNVMMVGTNVMPAGHHFSSTSRYALDSGFLVSSRRYNRCSVVPVRYFYIGFGFSHQYPEGPERTRILGIEGQAKVTPEISEDVPYNPFRADISKIFPIRHDVQGDDSIW